MSRRLHRSDDHVPTAPLRPFLDAERVDRLCCTGHSSGAMRRGIDGVTAALAERCDVSERTATRWIRAVLERDDVPLDLADRLCAVLGLPFSYVYAADGGIDAGAHPPDAGPPPTRSSSAA